MASFKQYNTQDTTNNKQQHTLASSPFSYTLYFCSWMYVFNPCRENLFWGYLSISLRGIQCTPGTIIVEVLALSQVVSITLISHNIWLKLSHFHTRYPYTRTLNYKIFWRKRVDKNQVYVSLLLHNLWSFKG